MNRTTTTITLATLLLAATVAAAGTPVIPAYIDAATGDRGTPVTSPLPPTSPPRGGDKSLAIQHGEFGGAPYAREDAAAVADFKAEAAAIAAGGYTSDVDYLTMEAMLITFDGGATYVTDRGGCIYTQTVVTGLVAGDIVEVDNDCLYNGSSYWNQAPYWVLISPYTHTPSNTINGWLIYFTQELDGTYTLVATSGEYNLAADDDDLTTVLDDWFSLTRAVKVHQGATLLNPLVSSRGYTYSTTGVSGGTVVQSSDLTTPDLDYVGAAPVWVNDDWAGSANGDVVGGHVFGQDAFTLVQTGINGAASGATVNVAQGPYTEQLHAVGKDLTVRGAGIGNTTLVAPATLIPQYTTTYPHYAVVCVENANVVIEDLTIDGAGRGNAHSRFLGLDLHNTGGRVEDVRITRVRNTPLDGAQHGVALYAYNETGGPLALDVIDCDLDDWQKNATVFFCEDGQPLDLLVSGCTVTGAGATGVTAQNGFQFSGADLTVVAEDNEIAGIGYSGAGWVACSILNYSPATVRNNTITDTHVGVYNIDAPAVITGNNMTIKKIGDYGWGIIATDPPRAVPSPFEVESAKGLPARDKSLLTADISDNVVGFSGPNNASTFGIEADAGYGPDDLVVTMHDNYVSGFEVGIEIWQCQSSCDTGIFTSVDASRNSVAGNTGYGVRSNASYLTVDATDCWWGDVSGPSGAGGGSGVPVSPYVDFDPWRTGNVVCTPDPLVLSQATPSGGLVVDYLGGGSSGVYGYSIEVQWSTAIATAGAFTRPSSGAFASAALFQVLTLGPGHVRIDAALGGSQPGILVGPLFQTTFTAVPGIQGGSTPVDLVLLQMRNSSNQPVTGVAADDGLIFVDTGLPAVTGVMITNDTLTHTDDYLKDTDVITVTATVIDGDPAFGVANITADLTALGGGDAVHPISYTLNVATWASISATCSPSEGPLTVVVTATDNAGNTATGSDGIIADNTPPTPLLGVTVLPGHEKVHLAWTGGFYDTNFYGFEFRYNGWGDYPEYDGAGPAYPATQGDLDGTLALRVASGTSVDWSVAPRDIYYVAGFVYDIVLHYSPAGDQNKGRATNYWLGDVTSEPGGYDGEVDIWDITSLGNTYGVTDGGVGWNAECNVGPTDTASPRGIPLPNADNLIGFEDLMIFALNFGVVTPLMQVQPGELPVLAWRQLNEVTWVLVLERPCAGFKGVNLAAALPAGVTCQVAPGVVLSHQSAPVFLRNIPAHGLDAGLAVFGQGVGIAGSGELAIVTFSAPVADLDLEIVARDLQNTTLPVELSGATAVALPTVTSLEQNYPNPFNPRTTIVFNLPEPRQVRLVVFGVDGKMVRTLVDESRAAGRHEIIWDGLDTAGRQVASGTYFYQVSAGDFREVRKMVLMK